MHDGNPSAAGAILIAGPTASGKSALALRLARQHGGVVVNADSMQIYRDLRVLTARPSEAEMEGVEHRLYGHAAPDRPYSVGVWMREAAVLLDELRRRGAVPVFCGGTGLYFGALTGRLDELPAVPAEVRDRWRERMEREGPQALHHHLRTLDAGAAERIRPSDPHRILRALELFEATGRPAAERPSSRTVPLIDPASAHRYVLAPPRERLRERIARRFERMIGEGAVAEAVAFRARWGEGAGLASQAIGLRELLNHVDGNGSLDEAVAAAVTRTRQYAKRQETWFRNQFDAGWRRVEEPHLVA